MNYYAFGLQIASAIVVAGFGLLVSPDFATTGLLENSDSQPGTLHLMERSALSFDGLITSDDVAYAEAMQDRISRMA